MNKFNDTHTHTNKPFSLSHTNVGKDSQAYFFYIYVEVSVRVRLYGYVVIGEGFLGAVRNGKGRDIINDEHLLFAQKLGDKSAKQKEGIS